MAKNYCPRCASAMEKRYIEGRSRDVCPACGFIHYRNPVPAVGVVVHLDEGVVLVRRKFDPCAGYWGLPAGYMEMGETAEEAALRECLEETGLQIQIDYLLGVYSYGDDNFSGLVIIYAATSFAGQLQAGDDATEVALFRLDNLPPDIAFHTHLQAIERWRRQESLGGAPSDELFQTEDGVVIRRAQRQDDQPVMALLPLLARAGPTARVQHVMADALFHDCLHDPDRPILVAEINATVAGFAAISFRQTLIGWRANIDELVVDPAYRRRGLGQALIEAVLRLARQRHCATLHIDTSDGNSDARSFFHACGFADNGVATLRIG